MFAEPGPREEGGCEERADVGATDVSVTMLERIPNYVEPFFSQLQRTFEVR